MLFLCSNNVLVCAIVGDNLGCSGADHAKTKECVLEEKEIAGSKSPTIQMLQLM